MKEQLKFTHHFLQKNNLKVNLEFLITCCRQTLDSYVTTHSSTHKSILELSQNFSIVAANFSPRMLSFSHSKISSRKSNNTETTYRIKSPRFFTHTLNLIKIDLKIRREQKLNYEVVGFYPSLFALQLLCFSPRSASFF